MNILIHASLLLTTVQLSKGLSMNCMIGMFYHNDYGYGYDIKCADLAQNYTENLQKIHVFNEIALRVSNSNLTDFSADLFGNISKLRQLDIRDSRLEFRNNTQLINLKQLNILRIENDSLESIPKKLFEGLDKLKILSLNQNLLQQIPSGTFSSLQTLEELYLTNNNFEYLSKMSICELRNLKQLNLTNNNIKFLRNDSLSCLENLQSLILAHNNIIDLYSVLQLHNLVELNLGYNHISDVDKAFGALYNLKHLNLEANKLFIINTTSFQNAKKIEILDMRNNSINNIANDAFVMLTKLKELYIQNNYLTDVYIVNSNALQILDLSNNKFTAQTIGHLQNLRNLSQLFLNMCQIEEVTQHVFQNFHNLIKLDLSNNRLKLSNESFHGLSTLQQLFLTNSSLYYLPSNVFKNLSGLLNLDLSMNNIREIDENVFSELNQLRTLNLSFNNMKSLNEKMFIPLKNLRTLDIAGNKLESLDFHLIINTLSNLQLITIKSNEFSCEFLTKMVDFLEQNHMSYSINDNFEYGFENVGGIRCREISLNDNTLQEAHSLLVNDTKLLDQIYSIAKNEGAHFTASPFKMPFFIMMIIFCLLLILTILISNKTYFIKRRRQYLSDNFELLETK